MSTTQRVVRPFIGSSSLEGFVDLLKLRVGVEEVASGGRIVLSDADYNHVPISVDLGDARARVDLLVALEEEGIYRVEDLELVIIASSNYLKLLDILHQEPLAKALSNGGRSRSCTDPLRPSALQARRSGCTISLYISLSKEIEAEPMKAWRAHTWLASADWRVSTQFAAISFSPKPLTEQVLKDFGLPKGTMRFLLLEESPALIAADSSIEYFVDEEVLRALSTNPKSISSIGVQKQLFIDAIGSMVSALLVDDQLSTYQWDDVKQSLLGNVIEAVSVLGPATLPRERLRRHSELLEQLKRGSEGPALFMAQLEAVVEVASATRSMLGGDQ